MHNVIKILVFICFTCVGHNLNSQSLERIPQSVYRLLSPNPDSLLCWGLLQEYKINVGGGDHSHILLSHKNIILNFENDHLLSSFGKDPCVDFLVVDSTINSIRVGNTDKKTKLLDNILYLLLLDRSYHSFPQPLRADILSYFKEELFIDNQLYSDTIQVLTGETGFFLNKRLPEVISIYNLNQFLQLEFFEIFVDFERVEGGSQLSVFVDPIDSESLNYFKIMDFLVEEMKDVSNIDLHWSFLESDLSFSNMIMMLNSYRTHRE